MNKAGSDCYDTKMLLSQPLFFYILCAPNNEHYLVTDWQSVETDGSHSHSGDIYSAAHASSGAAAQETSYGQPHMPTSHETVVVPRNMYDEVALDAQRVRRYPH